MIIVDVRSRDGSAIASRCGVTLFDDLLDDDEPGIVVPIQTNSFVTAVQPMIGLLVGIEYSYDSYVPRYRVRVRHARTRCRTDVHRSENEQ